MTKKFKAWLTPEEFGPDSRLCVAFEMPIGSGQFTVKTVPAKMVSEISMFSTTVDNSVLHELRLSAAQDGDPYLPISNEHVMLGRFKTQKEAASALNTIQKAVGYGRLQTRRIEGVGFLAAGFIVASVLYGLISTSEGGVRFGENNPVEVSSLETPYFPADQDVSPATIPDAPSTTMPPDSYYSHIEPGAIAEIAGALKSNASGVFQVGSGSPLAIVLSDPMCPSCKQTKALFEEAKLPYLVAPVGKLSPESVRTAVKIICANNQADYYSKSFDDRTMDIDTKNQGDVEACGEALLKNNELFDRTLSRGVPTFIRLADSELRPEGFDSAEELKAWLNSK